MNVKIRAKVWLEVGSGVPFCHGKAALLSAIRERGSIRQAARELKMSYRRAWEYIREVETGVRFTVVDTQVGGSHGGGARLTPRGAELLSLYETVYNEVSATMAAHRGTAV